MHCKSRSEVAINLVMLQPSTHITSNYIILIHTFFICKFGFQCFLVKSKVAEPQGREDERAQTCSVVIPVRVHQMPSTTKPNTKSKTEVSLQRMYAKSQLLQVPNRNNNILIPRFSGPPKPITKSPHNTTKIHQIDWARDRNQNSQHQTQKQPTTNYGTNIVLPWANSRNSTHPIF